MILSKNIAIIRTLVRKNKYMYCKVVGMKENKLIHFGGCTECITGDWTESTNETH
ncbi:hypothetical protein SBF1_840032 [Candidatus Desulfosporosinus infrequens]|uniref:Uncharacterized protein n=1 Tax=Candidatus Desulfosporosinus infrequens TaxID=2043169 RepID=A0A2U3LUN1_9FIRM|nr:hypothetical protein SBF1_840032 [Candidatus Desulfosporosinus infrequens]